MSDKDQGAVTGQVPDEAQTTPPARGAGTTRRRLIQGGVAATGAVLGMSYVKPDLRSIGLQGASAQRLNSPGGGQQGCTLTLEFVGVGLTPNVMVGQLIITPSENGTVSAVEVRVRQRSAGTLCGFNANTVLGSVSGSSKGPGCGNAAVPDLGTALTTGQGLAGAVATTWGIFCDTDCDGGSNEIVADVFYELEVQVTLLTALGPCVACGVSCVNVAGAAC